MYLRTLYFMYITLKKSKTSSFETLYLYEKVFFTPGYLFEKRKLAVIFNIRINLANIRKNKTHVLDKT